MKRAWILASVAVAVAAGCMEGRGYVRLKDHQLSPNLKTKALPLGGIAGGK